MWCKFILPEIIREGPSPNGRKKLNKKKHTVHEFEKILEGAFIGKEEEKVKLTEMLEPLIKTSIKRYYYGDMGRDDLIQEGKVKILECLKTFDEKKGVYFLGYVKAQLRYLYLNLCKTKGFEISLNSHIDMGEGSVELIDTLVDEKVDIEENFVKKSEFHNLILALDLLTNRESQIIRMYYFENIGMKDIARKLGLAYRTVVNTKVNGVEKVRAIVEQ